MARNTIVLSGLEPRLEGMLRAKLQDAVITVLADGAVANEQFGAGEVAIGVVAIGPRRDVAFRTVSALARSGAHVVVLGPGKDPDLILEAMREGAREYLPITEADRLVRVIRDQARPPRAAGLGSVVAVFPAKGGVGATSIVTNLAGAFARRGDRVCILDMDLAMCDTLAFLDLTGGYALSDVIANMQRIDRDLLEASVLRHASGVRVIAQSEKMEEASRIEPNEIGSLIHFLRQHYKAILLDGLRTFDDHAVAALDACDHVLVVVTQEVPAVRRGQRCVSFFRRLGYDDTRLRLVVNRNSSDAEIKGALIEETIGLPISARIANDYPALVRAMNRGRLLFEDAPHSQVVKDVDALRALVCEDVSEPAAKPSLLKRFFGAKVSHAS